VLPYTDKQKMIKEMIRRLAKEKIEPLVKELDKTGEGEAEVRKILIENDLFKLALPVEYGGINADYTTIAIAIEEISRIDPGIAMEIFGAATITCCLRICGNNEQQKRFFSLLQAGELGAFCLTEPDHGSDAANIMTRAELEGDHYLINGTKTMATNGPIAQYFIIFARTGPGKGAAGISSFIFDKDVPGISVGKPFKKLGFRSNPTSEVYLEDVRVTKEALLGKVGGAWETLQILGGAMRVYGASSEALGNAQATMEFVIQYAREKVAFGKPLIEHQAIQFMIAGMGIQIEAGRSLHYRTLQMMDSGNYSRNEYSLLSSATKAFVCDMAAKVTTDAVRVLGPYGIMTEYRVEKRLRDAKVNQTFDGTSEIQKMVVGRTLAKMYS
jgi:alkylation response protein AidB-like acyl-CoA dehydrogenase